ncbi:MULTISPECIES: aminodeoxychorismate synthase component I [unclassified Sphingopyxis]|uniref:aminodeoxychorismate synthase component I n=1 Tax=unclassified Sphingopyxis TaxID=2614943 RepID=UPI00285AB9BB|nr:MULTISPECIES: aminodeoxychorismate synthase component I [unclassified Sphingopyxis]MDR7062246.1 para-aminobenzoate synthetase/4-amino-4-deoxychorismate lyase [Sphingopyxis sp. BE235]MDR7182704.1 para-aminobenzoate synthetase/4-amino-4-deoxychorismate lyase [Sphingopyxis sp. BE249]
MTGGEAIPLPGPGCPPFVLLDDARAEGAAAARLFVDPVEVLTAHSAAEVPALLSALDAAQARGLHSAGYLTYEAGKALAPAWRGAVDAETGDAPLGWFGLFHQVRRIDADKVAGLLPDPASAWIGKVAPRVARADYLAAVEAVLGFIRAGDIYQANFTFRADVPVRGNPLAIHARLRRTARAGYGGVIWTGEQAIVSHSPELFFALRGGQVMARPMKGTAARLADPEADAAAARELAEDPKQRAENLMIVDLIRNDLSRVAVPGSVAVPDLFRVESFPTIHQLVSDVSARLPEGAGAVDVLRAAFPCGSITGAPKVRAMEIIDELESGARGLYTGSIGFIEPGGDAAFNVAIRTLLLPQSALQDGPACATLGLGSGIVADSEPVEEWRECLAKGEFVGAAGESFDLIETMFFDPVEGVQRIEGHLARMKASAAALGFVFDRHGARNVLQSATFRLRSAARVRMRLAPSGALAIEVSPLPRLAELPVPVAVRPAPMAADDFRLTHKTSLRAAYDGARHESGTAEVVFVDEPGFVTEGSWSNIFVERDGQLLTPPLALGLLPGVLRAELIDKGRAVESHLRIADLESGFFIGNSLRGLIPARLADAAASAIG